MPNVNLMVLQGHLGRDPEQKYMPNGNAVVNFSVAYSYKKDAPTSWFNCAAFGKNAELVMQYFTKGSAPLLQGRHESRKYTNKDGQEVTTWTFSVDRILDFGPRAANMPLNERAPAKQSADQDFDDDVPF